MRLQGVPRLDRQAALHLSTIHGLAFDVEILALAERIGYRIAEVPVRWDMVPGGKVNMQTDSPAMTRDVVLTRRRLRPARVLPYVKVAHPGDESPHSVAAEVQRHVRASNVVVPWRPGALALLPCAEPTVADRLRERIPDVEVATAICNPATLFHVSAAPLRRALVAV